MPRFQNGGGPRSTAQAARQLVDRYPETSHVIWVGVIIVGFLLVVPIAGGAMVLCVFAHIILVWSAAGSFLYGVVERSVLQPAVEAFDRAFPRGDGRRDKAIASLDRGRRHPEAAAHLRGALEDEGT